MSYSSFVLGTYATFDLVTNAGDRLALGILDASRSAKGHSWRESSNSM